MSIVTFLKNLMKTNKYAYNIYYFFGSAFLRFIGLFIRPNHNSILFVSFGGKKYDDSPRAIYEYMIADSRTANMNYYWAFTEPDKMEIQVGKKIKIDTIAYFLTVLKSGIWITNSEIGRGLKFKNKNIFCLNTWHGTPIKKIGSDANNVDPGSGFGSKDASNTDIVLAQGEFDAKIFARLFNINKDNIKIFGLPRNDALAKGNQEINTDLRGKLRIKRDKKTILYAPTYREFDRDNRLNTVIAPPIDFNLWRDKLGDKYVVLFRAHYEVSRVLNIDFNKHKGFLYNVTDYHSLTDLMLVSDILISDYSSIFFDYSILGRPMLCFAYDYERYCNNRGMYIDIQAEFPGGIIKTEDELLSRIMTVNTTQTCEDIIKFRNKYVKNYGKATELSVNMIIQEISEQGAC